MMITEGIILSVITVLGGGGVAAFTKYIEGKAQMEIESIKSRAALLEEQLENESVENLELRVEVRELKNEIDALENSLDEWKKKFWDLQVDTQELKMVFLKALERTNIPTDQFNAIIQRLNDDG